MDVSELLVELATARPDTSVIAATALPEASTAISRTKPRQNWRVEIAPTREDRKREPALQFAKDLRKRMLGKLWPEEKMHMLRHDYPAVQIEVKSLACVAEIDQELVANPAVVEKREPLIAGEGNKANAVWRLYSLDPLSVWGGLAFHCRSVQELHQFRLADSPGTGGTPILAMLNP